MTEFTDFTDSIKEWANRGDWSDALATSFVRGAEEKFNQDLRIDRMIVSNDALIASRCAPVPDDWLEFDLVMLQNDSVPSGWVPIRYKARDEFFKLPDNSPTWVSSLGTYTLEGRQLYFGGPPNAVDGNTVRISYYAEVPVFADDTPSWVYTKYQALYRYAALMHADLHAVGEEDRGAMLNGLVESMIGKLNAAHRFSRASGSRITRSRMRSFG